MVELTNKNDSHLRREERKYLIKIMETIKFLARQGIAFPEAIRTLTGLPTEQFKNI